MHTNEQKETRQNRGCNGKIRTSKHLQIGDLECWRRFANGAWRVDRCESRLAVWSLPSRLGSGLELLQLLVGSGEIGGG